MGHSQHAAAATQGQVIADGTMNPAQIPDDLALKHLFIHLSAPGTPTYNNVAAKARRFGLSDVEVQVLSGAIERFRNTFGQLQAKLVAVRPAAPTEAARSAARQAVVAINNEMMALVMETYSAILRGLTSDGQAKFAAYLAHVKSRIIVIAPPRM